VFSNVGSGAPPGEVQLHWRPQSADGESLFIRRDSVGFLGFVYWCHQHQHRCILLQNIAAEKH